MVKQIIYNIQLTIQYLFDMIIDIVFYPAFAVVNYIETITNQWNVKSEEDEQPKEENHHIGFNR